MNCSEDHGIHFFSKSFAAQIQDIVFRVIIIKKTDSHSKADL